jgi:Carbohydrate binding domain/Hypothetical glycosyl hydrolase family 15
MRHCSSFVIPCAAFAALCVLAASPVEAARYPRLGLYGSMYGDGFPLWDANGVLQAAALDQIARYDEVVLDASPITPYRPDAAEALRARNPDIRLLAYVTGHTIWRAANPDSDVHFPTRYRRLIDNNQGWLYNTGGQYFSIGNVNLAKRVGGRYVVAEGLADLFYDAIVTTGIWDGIFFDTYCNSILWADSPAERIDYQRAGFTSLAQFDVHWRAAQDTLGNRLRRLSGSSFLLVGNCGSGEDYASLNGWMRENFPHQAGGTWYLNLFRDPGGYMVDEARFRAPTSNWIFTATDTNQNHYSAANAKKMRFGFASAALGGGYGTWGPSSRNTRPLPYHTWWYDEYAVDLATGRSSAQIQHTGWLGDAVGSLRQMVWVGTSPDAVSNPDFETSVTTGWTFSAFVPATLTRDATTAARGVASARITIPTAAALDWQVNLRTISTLNVGSGQTYAATFWVKASSPRQVVVSARDPSSGGVRASATFAVSTVWTQVQMLFVPTSNGPVQLAFNVGLTAGNIWFDDVHLQAGATNVWRRDFQNGTVLVNPSSYNLTIPLERSFRKILGTVDPGVNNGATVNQVTVPANDALFLIGDDRIPPAAVKDLRPPQP